MRVSLILLLAVVGLASADRFVPRYKSEPLYHPHQHRSKGHGTSYPKGHGTSYPKRYGTSHPKGHGTSYPKGHGTSYPKDHGTSYPKGHGTSYPKGHGTSYPKSHGTPKGHGTSYPKGHGTSYPKSYGTPKGHGTSYPKGHGTSYPKSHGTPKGHGTSYPKGHGTSHPKGPPYITKAEEIPIHGLCTEENKQFTDTVQSICGKNYPSNKGDNHPSNKGDDYPSTPRDPHDDPNKQARSAKCDLFGNLNDGMVHGTLSFQQQNSNAPVHITGSVLGLATGLHGFHIHDFGVGPENNCTSAGGHFNPFSMGHGGPTSLERHVGDLGNIETPLAGSTTVDISDTLASLYGLTSVTGRGVVIHAGADDLGASGHPAGAAGGRVACCTIYATPVDD